MRFPLTTALIGKRIPVARNLSAEWKDFAAADRLIEWISHQAASATNWKAAALEFE
jgi:hypothetical protein